MNPKTFIKAFVSGHNHRLKIISAMLITLSLWAVASNARALPAATSQASVNSNNPPDTVNDPSSASLQGGTATVQTNPSIKLHAQVDDLPGVATQDAFSMLTYDFEVVGGNPGDTVPILIHADLLTTTSGAPSYSFAEVYTDGSGSSAASETINTNNTLQNSFDGSLSLTSESGQLRQLTVSIGAEEAYLYGGTPFASADDFYLSIDPAFADANDYRILVSPDVGNVPEPATWLMILFGGLALLPWSWRRAISVSKGSIGFERL